jgi:hypothetical protein
MTLDSKTLLKKDFYFSKIKINSYLPHQSILLVKLMYCLSYLFSINAIGGYI